MCGVLPQHLLVIGAGFLAVTLALCNVCQTEQRIPFARILVQCPAIAQSRVIDPAFGQCGIGAVEGADRRRLGGKDRRCRLCTPGSRSRPRINRASRRHALFCLCGGHCSVIWTRSATHDGALPGPCRGCLRGVICGGISRSCRVAAALSLRCRSLYQWGLRLHRDRSGRKGRLECRTGYAYKLVQIPEKKSGVCRRNQQGNNSQRDQTSIWAPLGVLCRCAKNLARNLGRHCRAWMRGCGLAGGFCRGGLGLGLRPWLGANRNRFRHRFRLVA